MNLVEGRDFIIREVVLPHLSVDGAVSVDENDFYTIYINARQTEEKKQRAIEHEIRHIVNGDFYRDVPVEEMEVEAG